MKLLRLLQRAGLLARRVDQFLGLAGTPGSRRPAGQRADSAPPHGREVRISAMVELSVTGRKLVLLPGVQHVHGRASAAAGP